MTRHRTRPPLWTALCPAGGLPPLQVPRPHAGSRNKNNTHQSILSDKEHWSSVVSMLARAVQKREKKHIPLAWLKHNSNFDNKVRKTQSLNSATKICSLLTSDFLNKTQAYELRPSVLQIKKRQHYLPRELAFKKITSSLHFAHANQKGTR